jgi:hypothetical protein
MPKMVQVCIGYAKAVPAKPRYQVTDESGPLRMFWTKAEAQQWMQPYMRLIVLPKPKLELQYIEVEEAWL